MATGFDKFKEKALNESPITINKATVDKDVTQERKEVDKFSRAAGVTPRSSRGVAEQEPARAVAAPAPVESTAEEKEQLFQLTIKIHNATKDKLEYLKYTQKKKLMELAEEAFEDLYNKYSA